METIQVSDREGHTLTGDVVERANAGDADLLQVWIAEAGMRISLILYPDGTQWTLWDWNDKCESVEDIPENRWLRQDKYGPGIVINGLPRALE